MTMAYNIAATHRLEPISGYNEIYHLQFTAAATKAMLECDNGSGEEPGMPSGSVVSINSTGLLEPGVKGTRMPMFLLWNTSDPDGVSGALTANGQNLASVSMNGAATGPNGNTLPENGILTREYPLDGNGDITKESGFASTLQRTWNQDGTVSSYSRRASVGNFTCWPATCGLELTSTEFDFDYYESGSDKVEFAPNTLLTGAQPADTPNTILATDTAAERRNKYQKNRGGYITPIDLEAAPLEAGLHNICGTVSRGIIRNENAVNVLYFWAERTLLPQVEIAESST